MKWLRDFVQSLIGGLLGLFVVTFLWIIGTLGIGRGLRNPFYREDRAPLDPNAPLVFLAIIAAVAAITALQ